jgi:hypothetical protein
MSILGVIGLSSILYGPILCFCAVTAISITLFYQVSIKLWDIYQEIKLAVSTLVHLIVPTWVLEGGQGKNNNNSNSNLDKSWFTADDTPIESNLHWDNWEQERDEKMASYR